MKGYIYNAKYIAEQIGTTPRNVRALARSMGVGKVIGTQWLFDDHDLLLFLQRRKPGRPRRDKT